MSVFIIEPEEAGALARLSAPGPRPKRSKSRRRLLRVEVDIVRRAWRVVLQGSEIISESTLRKLEQRLLNEVSGVDAVEFVFEHVSEADDRPSAAPVAAAAEATGELDADTPPLPQLPPADEYDDGDYLERILAAPPAACRSSLSAATKGASAAATATALRCSSRTWTATRRR